MVNKNHTVQNLHRGTPHKADRIILIGSIILGCLGIIALRFNLFLPPEIQNKQYFSYLDHPLITPAWAILILVAYAFFVRLVSSSQVEPETVGDNCYYLGFLFTLVSLAVTMYKLGFEAKENQILLEIISGFGIALSSTIVGIALRLWFFQQRTDIVARDRENQIEVQRAVKEFRLALSTSTSSLKQFTTESVQLTIERDKSIREATDKMIEQQSSRIAKIIEDLEGVVKRQQAMLIDNSEKFTQTMKTTFSEVSKEILQKHFEGTRSGFLELETSAKNLASNYNNLSVNNLDFITEIQDKASNSFMLLNKAMAELEDTTKNISGVLNNFRNNNLDGINELKETASTSFKLLNNAIAALEYSIQKVAGGLNQLSDDNQNLASGIQDRTTETWKTMNKSMDEVSGSIQILSEGVSKLNSEILVAMTEIQSNTAKTFNTLDNASDVYINTASKNTTKLQTVLEDSIQSYQTKVIELHRSLELNTEQFEKIVADSIYKGFANASQEISNRINLDLNATLRALENSAKQLTNTLDMVNHSTENITSNEEMIDTRTKNLQQTDTNESSGLLRWFR